VGVADGGKEQRVATLQTIQKIGPVLDLFNVNRPEWGVSEVAAAIGVPRSSAHALLSSLVETGLLQCRTRGRYRIGWRVVELHQTLQGTVDVRSCAAPLLQALSEKYGETVHLAVMERYRVLYVDKVLGNHVINVVGARVGAQLDAHCSAVGKVLLAHCDPGEIERNITNKPLRRLTPSTITNPAALAQELRTVRSTGCALDHGEAVPEVHCVAAPVRDDMGVVIAAVSMSVPASRFVRGLPEFKRAVIAAGAEISRAVAASTQPVVQTSRDNPTMAVAS
jgi:DNA-binding IclR family transcriptional regulator